MQATFEAYPLRFKNSPVRRSTAKSIRRVRTLRLAGLVLALAFIFLVAPRIVHPGTAVKQIAALEYTVVSGDSMWEIASQFAPGQDQRKVVAAIKRANGLQSAHLESGQVLRIPGELFK